MAPNVASTSVDISDLISALTGSGATFIIVMGNEGKDLDFDDVSKVNEDDPFGVFMRGLGGSTPTEESFWSLEDASGLFALEDGTGKFKMENSL